MEKNIITEENLKKVNESASELKEKGNKCIKEGNFTQAVNVYKQAIKLLIDEQSKDNELKFVLYNNLAEAYLKLSYNTKAYNAACEALKLNEKNEKAIFRKAKALFNLKSYQECKELLENTDSLCNSNLNTIGDSVKSLIDDCKIKIETKLTGNYDFIKLVEEESKTFYLDYADYINPKVEIYYNEGKGLGVKAKEVIKKGELISGTKALYCISLLNKNKEDLNLDSSDSEGKEIRNKILNLLINRVEDYKEYFSLYDGSNGNQNYNDRMKYFNSHIENNDKFNIDNSLSISKIDGIYENNGYNTLRGLKNQQFIARGIWIFPAFLNHSCVSNTTYFGIGDFLFIKAQKDIIKDQEITVGYLCYDKNYDERISIQKCSWGFKCRCVLCVYQEKLYYKKARLYAFNYLQCLSLANTNDFKYINRKKDVDFVDNLQEYKKNVSEQEEKEWINEFCLTPRKFYNFLIENEKEFLKAEMSILLSNYSCFVLNKHHLEDFIFIEITEKAYFYCNNFQINLEVNILVNIVQFYIGVKVFKKAKEYQAKLKKSISEIFGDDIRIQKLFVNANPIVLEKIK